MRTPPRLGKQRVAAALLGAALSLKSRGGLGRALVGFAAGLAGGAESAPRAHQHPGTEQIGLHVEPIEPAHVASRIDAVEMQGRHVIFIRNIGGDFTRFWPIQLVSSVSVGRFKLEKT
jgi:hypothetical protein